jgi:hypothetical protein
MLPMIAVATHAPIDPLAMLFDAMVGVAVPVPVLAGLAVTIAVMATDVHMHPRNPDANFCVGWRQ